MFSDHQHKIVFTGPVGAGKTTAIRTLSDIEPISTEQYATDETKNLKEETTVAMDYGSMMLGGKERIHLYGTPGQKRFDFMWEILSEGSIGLIVLANNRANDPVWRSVLTLLVVVKAGRQQLTTIAVRCIKKDIILQFLKSIVVKPPMSLCWSNP